MYLATKTILLQRAALRPYLFSTFVTNLSENTSDQLSKYADNVASSQTIIRIADFFDCRHIFHCFVRSGVNFIPVFHMLVAFF